MLPSPDILNDFSDGKFVLANLAAKRAKQLKEGAAPLVSIESSHPLTIALAEIAAGKIKPILPAVDEHGVLTETGGLELMENVFPIEGGLLLPSLEEFEDPTDNTGEDEEEADESSDDLSLSDLVDDEEDEPTGPISDDETLSLSDIADQEDTLEEDESDT
mgnify:CR=1 FL=1